MYMSEIDRPIEDEAIAARTDASVLVTAATRRDVERIARRIHLASSRAAAPLVPIQVGTPSAGPRAIEERCIAAFDAAGGGTVLLTMAEDLSPMLQHAIADLIDDRRRTQTPTRTARLITGTTVSLANRVAAGTFSDRLFYRLNVIHLVAANQAPGAGQLTTGELLSVGD